MGIGARFQQRVVRGEPVRSAPGKGLRKGRGRVVLVVVTIIPCT